MAVFLGFMLNRVTGEEFVAPCEAASREEAESLFSEEYPEPAYGCLTVYARADIEAILKGFARWPGVPSTVQPPLEELLARVRASDGGLPPLQAKANGAMLTRASLERVRHAANGHDPKVQALAARLLGHNHNAQGSRPASKAAEPESAPVAVTPPPQPAMQGKSLIEVLKTLRAGAS